MEEEGAHPLTLVGEEGEEEEDQLRPQVEVVVAVGMRHLTERSAAGGEAGGGMWARSRRAEGGGWRPQRKGEGAVEEEQACWGPSWQREAEGEAGCRWWGWRRFARGGLKVEAQRCQEKTQRHLQCSVYSL